MAGTDPKHAQPLLRLYRSLRSLSSDALSVLTKSASSAFDRSLMAMHDAAAGHGEYMRTLQTQADLFRCELGGGAVPCVCVDHVCDEHV